MLFKTNLLCWRSRISFLYHSVEKEYMSTFIDVISWLLKLLDIRTRREKTQNQRIIEYIDQCLSHMRTVMHQDESKMYEIEYAHKWLQLAHLDLLNVVENLAAPEECDILRQSLMSARVLHHAIRYGKVDDGSIQKDYRERFTRYTRQLYDQNSFRQNSNEVVLQELIQDGKVIHVSKRQCILDQIREVCMEDIARIDSLKERC